MSDREYYHPFLIGKQIYLRGLEGSDLQTNYFQWFNDQTIGTYTRHACFPNSMEKMREYYQKAIKNDDLLVLAIIYIPDNIHVGNVSLQNIDWINRCAEFAIIIGEQKYAGRGIATEAGKLIINHGFERLNLNRIWLGVHEANKAAIKAYKKIGFEEEGRFRQRFFQNEKFYDDIIMSILREEWVEMAKSEQKGGKNE